MTTDVAEYAARTAFVFVPNLCNAKCAFCYVRPSFAEAAVASRVVLRRAAVAAEALAALGFRSVRFTGGEPTLFSNLDEIVQPFLDRGFTYRVLSNGLDLQHVRAFFESTPPERFTISVHTSSRPGQVFGMPSLSVAGLAENRRWMAAIAPLEATFVVEHADSALDEVHATLEALHTEGVQHIKVILENSRQPHDSRSFARLTRALSSTWSHRFTSLRFTDPRSKTCGLRTKGYPAVELGHGRFFACCVQVGDRPAATGYSAELPDSPAQAETTLQQLMLASARRRTVTLPCSAGHEFCPLALAA